MIRGINLLGAYLLARAALLLVTILWERAII
jgi:hypothetical protein